LGLLETARHRLGLRDTLDALRPALAKILTGGG
jgi:hypothetical protein